MTIRRYAWVGNRIDGFCMVVGWGTVAFPTIYMSAIADGEHANVQVGFGLLASGLQSAVWTAIWFVRRLMEAPKRRMMFPIVATLSLAGFVSVASATDSLMRRGDDW